MPFRITRFLPFVAVVLAIGFLPRPAFSQVPGGRTALAAKQHLKNEVVGAMADGKISKVKRAEILAEAKEILTVKEYEGLVETMDRLSPPEEPLAATRHSAANRVVAPSVQDREQSPALLGRMLSHVPYVDDFSLGPHPQVSKIPASIPYAKTPEIDGSRAKQALGNVSRLRDTYVDPPSADRPLPKVTHAERSSASGRMTATSYLSRQNQVSEKRSPSKYADESISPVPAETNGAEQNITRRPKIMRQETGPLAGERSAESESTELVTPAGAILPDHSIPPTCADKPAQPQGLEAEFSR